MNFPDALQEDGRGTAMGNDCNPDGEFAAPELRYGMSPVCPTVRRIGALRALAAHQMNQLHMTAAKFSNTIKLGL